MSVLVLVSRDFERGRTWLAGGVDRQSRMGLIFSPRTEMAVTIRNTIATFLHEIPVCSL